MKPLTDYVRENAFCRCDVEPHDFTCPLFYIAALDAKDAEIGRLREALRDFLENPAFQVGVGGNPIAVNEMLAKARAALSKQGEE